METFRVLFAGLPQSGKKALIELILYGKPLNKHSRTKTLVYHKAKVSFEKRVYSLTFVDLPTENTRKYLTEEYLGEIDLLICVIGMSQLVTKKKEIVDLYWRIMDITPAVEVLLCVNKVKKVEKSNCNVNECIRDILKDIGGDKFFITSVNNSEGSLPLLKEILYYAKLKSKH